jgi:hypothetical protein
MKNKTRHWGCLTVLTLLLTGCGGGGGAQEKLAYQLRLETAGELAAKQAMACLSQMRSYWAIAEYAKASEIDFATAARQMQDSQTRANISMMRSMKSDLDGRLEGLSEPPPEFEEAFPKLEALYAVYTEIHTFVTDPPDDMSNLDQTIREFQESLSQAKLEFDRALAVVVLR